MTKEIIEKVDRTIAAHERRIAALEKKSDISKGLEQSAENADRIARQNVEFAAENLVDEFKKIFTEASPLADAVGKGIQAKKVYDRAIDTLSWDQPALDALAADESLTEERAKVEKLKKTREALSEYQILMTNVAAMAAQKVREGTPSPTSRVAQLASVVVMPHSFSYLDSNGEPKRVDVQGESFIIASKDSPTRTQTVRSLRYLTWDRSPWQAVIKGKVFMHTPERNGSAHPDTILNYLDWNGARQQVRISVTRER